LNSTHQKGWAATPELARRIASALTGDELFLLYGELGTGKTTFVGWLAEALGIEPGLVSSPSYTLIQPYPPGERGIGVVHVDLYRLNREAELDDLGLEDYLVPASVMVVEWPELGEILWRETGRPIVSISFKVDDEGTHRADISAPFSL